MTPLAAPRPKIRVLCVDDSEDAAEMLDRCIAFQPDMESAGTLRSVDELCAEVVALCSTSQCPVKTLWRPFPS